MRRMLVVASLLLSSCGGSPVRPSPAAASPALPVSLAPGAYTLTITLSRSGLNTCGTGGVCASVSLCIGTPDATTAQFDVQIERSGNDVQVRADGGTVSMTLDTAPVPATGSITAAGVDLHGVLVDVRGTLTGTGSANPAVAASGVIDGQVTFGGGGCSNNGHTWTVVRR